MPFLAPVIAAWAAFAAAHAVAAFIIKTVVLTALSHFASKLFAPKQKLPQRQASVVSLTLGEAPREAIFGYAATGGTLANATNYGGTYGTKFEARAIFLADHLCDDLVGFYVDDTFHAFTVDGVVSGFSNRLWVYFLPGIESPTLPAVATNLGFSAGDFKGMCTVFVIYECDDKVWSTGRPEFLWVVKGKKCYDPRLDSTVPGGSGAHRWATPSTWAWSENAAICRYNWVRGVFACDRVTQPEMLLVGRGLSETEAPPERVIAYANTCDEAVALDAGGTEPRYRVGCVIRADEQFDQTEEHFAAAMGGVMIQREGSIEIEPGTARSVVGVTITDAEIETAAPREFDPFFSSSRQVNSVVPRFIDPDQRWRDASAPIRRDTADITADGDLFEEDYSLPFVTSRTQAERCAEIYRRQCRLERSLQITLPPRFSCHEDGDWVTINSARYTGGVAVIFRVEAYAVAADWRITMTLREITANVYAWTTADEGSALGSPAVIVTPPTTLSMPAITIAAGTLTGTGTVAGTIEATWTPADVDTAIKGALMEYRVKSGPGPTKTKEMFNPGAYGKMVASDVADGVLHEARVEPIPHDPARVVAFSAWADVTPTAGTALPPATYDPPVPDVNLVNTPSFEDSDVGEWDVGGIQVA